jgi:hypothetical protein
LFFLGATSQRGVFCRTFDVSRQLYRRRDAAQGRRNGRRAFSAIFPFFRVLGDERLNRRSAFGIIGETLVAARSTFERRGDGESKKALKRLKRKGDAKCAEFND